MQYNMRLFRLSERPNTVLTRLCQVNCAKSTLGQVFFQTKGYLFFGCFFFFFFFLIVFFLLCFIIIIIIIIIIFIEIPVFFYANSVNTDQRVATDMGLFYLTMSVLWDTRHD